MPESLSFRGMKGLKASNSTSSGKVGSLSFTLATG